MYVNRTELLRALREPALAPLQAELEAFETAPRSEAARRRLGELHREGERLLSYPIPALSWHDFSLFWSTGDRAVYEDKYFDRRERLAVFAMLARFEPENPAWADGLTEALWAILGEVCWALPAHYFDALQAPLPAEKYPTHLDLFACETGCAIAEALRLAGSALPEKVAALAADAVRRRCLAPFSDPAAVWCFEGLESNWCAVCGGALGMAALYLEPDPERLCVLLTRSLASLECYLHSFGGDGVCVEGGGYWLYGFGFFTCFAEMLRARTHGRFDYFRDEKVCAIARSQSLFYFSGHDTVSFADGYEASHWRAGLSRLLQKRTGAPLPPAGLECGMLEEGRARLCIPLRDLLWDSPAEAPAAPAPAAQWLPDAGWFLCRRGPLTLAAKAGHNAEGHNHNDSGSFELFCGGRAVLCDLGAGLYDAGYFVSEVRYSRLVARSGGHNLPLADGAEQRWGREYEARVLSAEPGAGRLEMELAACYPQGSVQSLRRRLCLSDAGLELTDTADFGGRAAVLSDVFCAREPIGLTPARAELRRGGRRVVLSFDAKLSAGVRCETYADHDGVQQQAWLLTVSAPAAPRAELAFRVLAE